MYDYLKSIPDVNEFPLNYIFDTLKYQHLDNTLWLEFGVASGQSINYISSHTPYTVYGFDSFEGLPEKWRDGFDKGAFNMSGNMPNVNENVKLIKGWFENTLPDFLKENNDPISFIHMDADLYSSTKFIFGCVKHRLTSGCIVLFDELLNYTGFDGDTGELKALDEFLAENDVDYEWIGMHGTPFNCPGRVHEPVAMRILSVSSKK
jgi:hypothetical protein